MISGPGGWYANHRQTPMGVGAVSLPPAGAGEQALQEIVKAATPVLVTPWASQEGSFDWQEITPEWNVALVPMTDGQLAAAAAASFGHPVNWVGVICQKPIAYETADSAFESSRYQLVGADAVYRQDDAKPTPTAWFLYVAELRGDTSGGPGALAAVAQRLGGTLVFPVEVPLGNQRPRPALGFQAALEVQLGSGAVSPRTDASTAPAMPAAPGAPRDIPWPLVFIGGAAAVAVGAWAVRSYRRRAG